MMMTATDNNDDDDDGNGYDNDGVELAVKKNHAAEYSTSLLHKVVS
jgi:hypothetical protein